MADEYFIVDDVLDEAGHEGFELLFGDPVAATGCSQRTALRLLDLKRYLRKHHPHLKSVARVFLARRWGPKARVTYLKL